MEENKNARRRERIKTILIFFLLILLLLTFFSNTIMNHSLPTVSIKYAGYGQISENVRGSGVVTANQTYHVNAKGNRKVKTVNAKAGAEIKAGDILFVLESTGDEDAVKSAENDLREAELNYQKALLKSVPDYLKENQEIANARADLQKSMDRLNEARAKSNAGITAAAYQEATRKAESASNLIAELKGYAATAESGSASGLPSRYASYISSAQAELDAANAALESAKADLDAKTSQLTGSSAEQEKTITTLERAAEAADTAAARAKVDYELSNNDLTLRRAMEDAQSAAQYAHEDVDAARKTLTELKAKEAEVAAAKEIFNRASASVDSATLAKNAAVISAVSAIEQDIAAAQQDYNAAKAITDAYTAQGEAADLTALEDAVSANEKTLQNLIIALSETKKENELTNQGASIDLRSQQLQIQQKRDALEKLRKNSGTVEVKSENDGIISAVNFAAGDEVMDGAALADITLTNSGYVVEFSVTPEQARKVKIGVNAEITNAYYSDITAKLISAKADVKNPSSQNKLLTFDITGRDVTPGQLLALSIPCSTQNYDCVIPSSALQTDNDGKFVLVLKTKSTPLGNRYYASRVNVTVLASDDLNSAVQGDLEASDYVITTAEKPIKPGDQVRMEDT